jgi:carbonic anhydrase
MSWAPFGSNTESDPPPAAPAAEPAAPAAEPDTGSSAAYLPREPGRRLAVVTCMDSRLDPLRDLGLARGDAMVLRNAGATISDDVERSLRVAQERAGIQEVWLVGHSDCVAHGMADAAVEDELRRGLTRVRGVLPGLSVRALFYDFASSDVRPVEPTR